MGWDEDASLVHLCQLRIPRALGLSERQDLHAVMADLKVAAGPNRNLLLLADSRPWKIFETRQPRLTFWHLEQKKVFAAFDIRICQFESATTSRVPRSRAS